MPHLTNECLDDLKVKERNNWPVAEKKFLKKERFDIVVQINGRKRDLMNFNKEVNEKDLLMEIKKNEKLKKFIDNKEVKKSIYIKNKLINLII